MVEIGYRQEVVRPGTQSLEELRESYDGAISRAKSITEKQNLKTAEGKLALTFLLATGNLLKTAGSNLQEVTGGQNLNPERKIDLVGGEISDILIKEFLEINPEKTGLSVYVEERKKWEEHTAEAWPFRPENPGKILIDPCDETSSDLYKTVGISIFDKDYNFLAGGIAGVSDETTVFIEGDRVDFVGFDGGKNSLKNPLQVFAPQVPDRLKIAALGRRFEDERMRKMVRELSPEGVIILPTFGGYGLLAMLRGEIDIMLDPFKGQPWYEAAQWVNLARKLGFTVRRYYQSEDGRYPLAISRNAQIDVELIIRDSLRRSHGLVV